MTPHLQHGLWLRIWCVDPKMVLCCLTASHTCYTNQKTNTSHPLSGQNGQDNLANMIAMRCELYSRIKHCAQELSKTWLLHTPRPPGPAWHSTRKAWCPCVLVLRMEEYLSRSHSSEAPAALAASRQPVRRGLGAADRPHMQQDTHNPEAQQVLLENELLANLRQIGRTYMTC